jgi:hypothetical protein
MFLLQTAPTFATRKFCSGHCFRLRLPTLYKWKVKYGGMGVADARRLKGLEEENRRLADPKGRCARRQTLWFAF